MLEQQLEPDQPDQQHVEQPMEHVEQQDKKQEDVQLSYPNIQFPFVQMNTKPLKTGDDVKKMSRKREIPSAEEEDFQEDEEDTESEQDTKGLHPFKRQKNSQPRLIKHITNQNQSSQQSQPSQSNQSTKPSKPIEPPEQMLLFLELQLQIRELQQQLKKIKPEVKQWVHDSSASRFVMTKEPDRNGQLCDFVFTTLEQKRYQPVKLDYLSHSIQTWFVENFKDLVPLEEMEQNAFHLAEFIWKHRPTNSVFDLNFQQKKHRGK